MVASDIMHLQPLSLSTTPHPLPKPSNPKPHPPLTHRPLRHLPLPLDARNDLLQPRLYNHAPYNHLPQDCMQCFKVENQIQLAHVLEEAIEGFDEDLDEVEEGEGGFGGGGDEDEVEGCVVAVSY